MASLDAFFTGGPVAWRTLPRALQLLVLAAVLILPVVFVLASQWISEGQYVPIFSGLAAEDAGAVVAQLKSSKTPYRVSAGGDQILVPADKVAELRLRLAGQGLPIGGGVGFEVFDRSMLGMSDFTQRLNYQRALQGELARTIGQLREVKRVRVHLVLPQPALFAERERPASASVFVKLAPGAQLGREQIRGIVQLVASSVEGLAAERVTVVDTGGQVLAMGGDSGAGAGALSPRRLELKSAIEESVERRVQSMLDAALGAGQAVARVAAQVNFDQIERTEEKYDPAAVPKQKTRSTESSSGKSATPTGLPTPPQDPTAPPAKDTASTSTNQNSGSRESESITYEVSRTVARTLTTPGDLQRLSVAVLLKTATRVTKGADGKESSEAAPRTAEAIEKIRKVVMSSVGFNETRGDDVTVVEMPFDTSVAERERALLDAPAPPPVAPPAMQGWIPIAAGAGAVMLLAIVALVIRGLARGRAAARVAKALEHQVADPGRVGDVAAPAVPSMPPPPIVTEELMALGRQRDDIRQRAVAMATDEPEATAHLLRAWLVKKKALQPTGRGGHDAG